MANDPEVFSTPRRGAYELKDCLIIFRSTVSNESVNSGVPEHSIKRSCKSPGLDPSPGSVP